MYYSMASFSFFLEAKAGHDNTYNNIANICKSIKIITIKYSHFSNIHNFN